MSDDIVLNRPVSTGAELEAPLSRLESRVEALGEALKAGDPVALECAASELHRALAGAVESFKLAARRGSVPPLLRHRLAAASARVAAQRESLARVTASLDRAIDVLLPGPALAGYGAAGHALRTASTGSLAV
ncbi:MAG: hypothetical protein RI988_2301 [Pseudomonadota bacterium]|jgi:hypothetical protein